MQYTQLASLTSTTLAKINMHTMDVANFHLLLELALRAPNFPRLSCSCKKIVTPCGAAWLSFSAY